MKQGNQALSVFLPTWEESASIVTWNDDAKITVLKGQLHPSLINRLSFEKTATTFPAFLVQIREKDALLRHVDPSYHKKSLSTHYGSTPQPIVEVLTNDPMDLSTFRINGVMTWTEKDIQERKTPRTDEERAARKAYNIKHNLCQWDSSKDHLSNDYPSAPWNKDKGFYKGNIPCNSTKGKA